MAINIQSLFSDIIETPAQRQERMLTEGILKGRELTGGLTGLARTQAPLVSALAMQMPQRQEAMRRGVGGMLGLDVRTAGEKAEDVLRGVNTNTVAGLIEAANRVGNIPGLQSQALGLRQAAAELAAQKRQDELREQQIESERLTQNLTRLEIERAKEQNVTGVGNFTWKEGEEVKYGRGGIKDNKVVIWNGSDWVDAPEGAVEVSARGAGGGALSSDAEDLITEYETAAISAGDELNSLSTFMSAFEQVEITPGMIGMTQRAVKEFLGQQDEENQIVQRLNAIVNKRAIDNLPKGAASDTDVALVLKGEINPNNATPEQIRAYINIAMIIEAQDILVNERKSMYVKENNGSTSGLSKHVSDYIKGTEGEEVSELEADMMARFPGLFQRQSQTGRSERGAEARALLNPESSEYLDQEVQNVRDYIMNQGSNLTPRSAPARTDTASILGSTRNPMLRRQ